MADTSMTASVFGSLLHLVQIKPGGNSNNISMVGVSSSGLHSPLQFSQVSLFNNLCKFEEVLRI